MKTTTKKFVEQLVQRYAPLAKCHEDLMDAVKALICCYEKKNKLLICGNGGSAADAEHIVGELMKGFLLPRRLEASMQRQLEKEFPEDAAYFIENLQQTLPAMALDSQISLRSAFANDQASDLSFAQQVLGYGKEGDLLLAISTSGNSRNVLYAAKIARLRGIKVISLTGSSGGKLAALSDISIKVPAKETYAVQEYHLPVYHMLCASVENEFFSVGE